MRSVSTVTKTQDKKKYYKMTQVSNTSFVSNWLRTFNPNHANDVWIPETDTLNEISFSDCRRFFFKTESS